MGRPRVHKLSGGPRGASARPRTDEVPWWTIAPLHGVAPGASDPALAGPLDAAGQEALAARRLGYLARLATSVRTVGDAGLFTAVGETLRSLGLQGLVAMAEPDGAALVVKALFLGEAGTAEVERVLGEKVVGARIPLEDATPYRTVLETRSSARVDGTIWWARLASPGLGPEEASAIARLIGLGDAVLAPIVAGQKPVGVLTVWAASLDDADVSTLEIVANLLGSAVGRAA
jgi:hypothetical protein